MTQIVFSFQTPEQANSAVVALSCGYKVEQWSTSVCSTGPYHVAVLVPSSDVTKLD